MHICRMFGCRVYECVTNWEKHGNFYPIVITSLEVHLQVLGSTEVKTAPVQLKEQRKSLI